MSLFGTGWATGNVVVAHCAELCADVVEDTEFGPSRVSPDHRLSVRFWWQELGSDGLPGNQPGKLVTGHLWKRIQVAHLLLKIFIGTVKPEALGCAPVNTQRPTDGIAILPGLQHIMLGEDFNPFLPAPLDRHAQPQGKAANVHAAVTGWERLRQEYPEMSAPTAILKSRLHPVLPEVEAELEEIRNRILIVRVDGHPLRTLGGGVHGVEADGDITFEVTTDCARGQAEPLAGLPVLGTVVVMPGTFRVRTV